MVSLRLILGCCLCLLGCREFLTVDPENDVSREQIFSSERGAEAAVVGLYSQLSEGAYYEIRMPIYADLQANMAAVNDQRTVAISDIDGFRRNYLTVHALDAGPAYDNANYDDLYAQAYTVLYQANDVVGGVARVPGIPEHRRRSLTGEALTIRALVHHDLVRLFAQAPGYTANGDHPGIVLATDVIAVDEEVPRATVAEVYASIRSDLETAYDQLDIDVSRRTPEPYWITPAVAAGLLARVNAYEERWEETVRWADSCLKRADKTLTPRESYVTEWLSGRLDESLWMLDKRSLLNPNGNPSVNSPAAILGAGNMEPYLQVSPGLLELFSPNDLRRDLIARNANGDNLSLKWPFDGRVIRDIPLLRLSEVYLLRAEALAELGLIERARRDYERVYHRAVPDSLAAPTPTDAGELIDAIRAERRRELALEGHHFFDLGRWGLDLERAPCADFIRLCNLSYPDARYILPIPRDALLRNTNLVQNEGY